MMRILFFLCLLLAAFPADRGAAETRFGEMALKNFLGGNRNYWIPSGSMRPGLWPGDLVSARPAKRGGPIERGDVIFFVENGVDFTKRVIAVGGDRISMRGGVPVLNGEVLRQEAIADVVFEVTDPQGPLPRCTNGPARIGEECVMTARREYLPSGRNYVVVDTAQTRFDDTEEFLVPVGSVFVMGDNRDNSLDSRMPRQTGGRGMVALENIKHRGGFIFRPATDAVDRPSDF